MLTPVDNQLGVIIRDGLVNPRQVSEKLYAAYANPLETEATTLLKKSCTFAIGLTLNWRLTLRPSFSVDLPGD